MPQQDKPYLWLDKDNLMLHIRIWSNNYQVISAPYPESDEDSLRIIYILSSNGNQATPMPLKTSFDLNDRRFYDPSIHTRVTVVLKNSGDVILGFCTVKPEMGTFGTVNLCDPETDSAAAANIIPYLYIKQDDTENATVYVASYMESIGVITDSRPEDDLITYERKVDFGVNASGNPMEYVDGLHLLDSSTGFDPVLDTIIISVTENDGGEMKRKGTGTVHTSEADASSAG